MITYTTSKTDEDFSEIIRLQKANLLSQLPEKEMQEQGFVTVVHTSDDLKKMNNYEPNLILKDKNKIVGYLLAMTKNSRLDIPVLIPMFELFDKICFMGKAISEYNFIVVGQVCIQKDYRGIGLLDKSYEAYKDYFKDKYDFAITEIATSNKRSISGHNRIGFREIHTYTDSKNIEWSIVIWDWKLN